MKHYLVKANLKCLVSFLVICLFLANCENKLGMSLAILSLINNKNNSSSGSKSNVKNPKTPRLVKKVTLGHRYSFIETKDTPSKLFVFGNNSGGQLGLGDFNLRKTPTELTNSNIAGKVKKVTLGGGGQPGRSFIETTDNKLFVFGYNGFGELGLGNTTHRSTPIELTNTDIKDNIAKVTLGGNHSFIETKDGKLFVFGRSTTGELGLGDNPQTSHPSKCGILGRKSTKYCHTPIELTVATADVTTSKPIARGNVKKVTLGGSHSFIETTDNKLFVFGYNSSGQLGLGASPDSTKCVTKIIGGETVKYCHTPVELKSMKGKVKKVTLGENHSFIETTDTPSKLFVFGHNTYGQLGLGDTNNRNIPTELTNFNIKGKVKKVTLGRWHSFIETTDNKLFVFGSNSFGQLGLGGGNRNTPAELVLY